MQQSLFSTNAKDLRTQYLIFGILSVIVGLFLTFSLFFEIPNLSFVYSSLRDYCAVDGISLYLGPIIYYSNAETDKDKILSDNKDRAGVYQWTHNQTGRIYIGSAIDLSNRLSLYFSALSLKRVDNYICRALLKHSHSAFSLSILRYVDITSLSKEEARKLVLSGEQFYLDLIFSVDEPNTYNMLKVAGSPLGYKHTDETIANMCYRTHSAETKALLSEINKGKSMSTEAKAKMSEAKVGEKNPMSGKTHTAQTLDKMSIAKGTAIYVYDSKGILVNIFSSARRAGKFFDCSYPTILRYARSGLLFKEEWKLSTSLISKES